MPIENNYSKSIKKDPYKQNLVDALYPEYAEKDRLIIQKLKILFPEFNLEDILDNFQDC